MTSPIVVDANVFLRYIVQAATPQDEQFATESASLFFQCEQGLLEITTNVAVIAEVVFILSSIWHYALSRAEAVSRLAPLLRMPGCKIVDKNTILEALDRWQLSAKMSYVDALVIEQARANGAQIASFDKQVRATSGVDNWNEP